MIVGIAIVALVLATGFTDAADVERSTKTVDGQGSLGTDSPVELFLVGGLYSHELDTHLGCPATAGLFPATRQPAVELSEVLRPTDLAAYLPNVSAERTGSFRITTPGWATLQIGTGPDCAWTYTATGRFPPLGEEPQPPASPGQPWVLWISAAAAAMAAGVVGLRIRRQRSTDLDTDGVRVLEPDVHEPV